MKKYGIIYADPPWQYQAYSRKGKGRTAESHYPTMDLENIKALPVPEIAAKDCALFMWSTFPCLQEALEVIRAWGFEYKTAAFIWVKQNRKADSLFWGMGYWTRANAELCILATKGHPKCRNAGVHQVILSHVEQHSKKPDKTRDRIVRLMGDIPRIELFARQSPEGWDVGAMRSNVTLYLERRLPMAFVPVPKDLSRVKTKVLFNLTKRQLICFTLAAAVGAPVYLLTKPSLGISTAAMLMVVIMLPFVFFAIYEKDGQPAEKVLGHVIRFLFLRDRVRPYRTNNLYAAIQQQIKEKEELHIEQQLRKGKP